MHAMTRRHSHSDSTEIWPCINAQYANMVKDKKSAQGLFTLVRDLRSGAPTTIGRACDPQSGTGMPDCEISV